MRATHFLTRTIERVWTEMSLLVLAYNMDDDRHPRRAAANKLGMSPSPLCAAMRAADWLACM